MHEVSLAQNELSIVEEAALRDKFTQVSEISISIGKLAGVEIDSFIFALENLGEGTILNNTRILITQPDASANCQTCAHEFTINERWQSCPNCQSNDIKITDGLQLKIIDLIVRD